MKLCTDTVFILRVSEMITAFAGTAMYIFVAMKIWKSEDRKYFDQMAFPIGNISMLAFIGYSEILLGLVIIQTLKEPAKNTIVTILLMIGTAVNLTAGLGTANFIYSSEQTYMWFTTVGFALCNACLMTADLVFMYRKLK